MLPVVDANIILRYLLADVEDQYEAAKTVIDNGCETTVEVIAEVVYVLAGVYAVPRAEISRSISALLDYMYVERHDEVAGALEVYGETALDFVDCVLVAMSKVSGRDVVTFDKKLKSRI